MHTRTRTLLLRLLLLALAAVAPNVFPASQIGFGSLHHLAMMFMLPAVVAIIAVWLVAYRVATPLAALVARAAVAGAIATLALEAIRYPGFRMGFMPGNLPQLMGVLLLDRFALGPSSWSNLAGFAYHAWNGASFAMIFALLAIGASRWWAVPFGVAVGVGFLASPVVLALGVGPFGRDFGWPFAATVLSAHLAFGTVLALMLPARLQATPR